MRRHLAETGKTKIYGKRDEARVCGSKSGRNPRQDHKDEWRQLTCAKSIPMKFTACKEHLPSCKTNTVRMFWLHIKAMLFVTENKDSCDSTAALRFSGHKWQKLKGCGNSGEERGPPPYNGRCHPLKGLWFWDSSFKTGHQYSNIFILERAVIFRKHKNWQYKQRYINLGRAYF